MATLENSRSAIEKRFDRLNELADDTIDKSIEMMNKYGKVMVVRPTGFGKTRMAVRIGKMYADKRPGKRILYVYPIDVIKTEIMNKEEYMRDGIIGEKFDFVSYWTLTNNMNKYGVEYWIEEIKDKYSLIILDEVHRAGSENFNKLYDGLKDTLENNDIHLIGLTATPRRMMDDEDNNVLNNIFDNCEIERLTLYDIIREGVMPQPIYMMCEYEADDQVTEFINNNYGKDEDGQFNSDIIRADYARYRDYLMAHNTIYEGIKMAGYNLANPKERYLKFIVFFSNIEDMAIRGPQVEEWFDRAINETAKRDVGFRGDFDINSYYVASRDTDLADIEKLVEEKPKNRDFFKNTGKLSTVTPENKTVDLLFTVDMINMGYHVDGICGVVLLRGTQSEIVYYQQIGRCLSVTSMKSAIIYDFVKNVERIEEVINGGERRKKDGVGGGNIRDYVDEKDKDPYDDDVIIKVNRDIMAELMDKWRDPEHSIKAKVEWMYVHRRTPICVIASTLDRSCREIGKMLTSMGIKLKEEDDMYYYQERLCKSTEGKEDYVANVALMRFICSQKTKEFFMRFKKRYTTLFDLLMGRGG